ncbi:SDR family NAD(P)-dependent oxidoreductase [Burkholderia anthina]|uniref:SDR family NAD(P)-dependent oxidoreductase n=1 Tax=Burkholderia anthina TaxID=179879 RepID=UPI001AA0AF21|nr:SDR family NAD(P)-dependent oxidoreductase [Burkholderia anthina]QTD92048.1 SDR family oxidoreductase [Burkholderia anthina]
MAADDIFAVKDQVVCISGASRGLGKGLARMFAERGAHVVIGSYDARELSAAQAELAADGLDISTVVADVSDPNACAALVEQTVQKFGRIDTMICNAGVDKIKPAEDYESHEWDQILDVNLKGAYFCAKYAAKAMLSAGRGSIVMTSSIAGSSGISGLTPYAASKGGIDQLVRTMAVEWAPRGVRVNAVAPGYINNFMDGVDNSSSSPYQQRAMARTPMARRGEIGEFGGAYIYLASDASSYVTGTVLFVDGGYNAA